jgi:rhodanese-related sulfurtransferase
MLLADGFSHVTNTKGGMSEWYRDYPELEKYRNEFYVTTSNHVNIAPVALYKKLAAKQDVVLMSFTDTYQQLFDTNAKAYYRHFPDLKKAMYFRYADSADALQKAKAANGKPIVIFNTTTGGGAEMAEYLTAKGIKDVSFLIGNLPGFYEYVQNYQPNASVNDYFTPKSSVQYFTPPSFCRYISQHKDFQIVDIRPDTLFNKITNGTKLDYKYLKGAVNFPADQSADAFAQRFPDKNKLYVLTQTFMVTGQALVDELIKKGYKIGWLMGGNERWEWYTNNIEWFECRDYFVK